MKDRGVLHLIDSLGIGGAQRRLFNDLAHFNDSLTHRVISLFPHPHGHPTAPRQDNVRFDCLNLRRAADLPSGVWNLTRLIRKDPGVCLIHTQLFWADTLGRLAGRLTRRPVISTFQSAVYEPDSGLYSPWRRWVDQKTSRLTHQTIAVSEFVKRSIYRRLNVPLSKISVIPNSVDLQHLSPDPIRRSRMRSRFHLSDVEFVWLTVGRLNPPKDHRTLFSAMARLLEQHPQTRLWVVGDGPDRKTLEIHSKNQGLEKVIWFSGEQADVTPLLDAADGFVFPSLSEGLPVALLEAMAFKKPVVASRIGPHEEVIEEGRSGLLVEPQAPQALAEGMIRVQRNLSWAQQMGDEARQRVGKFYEASSCAGKLEALYESLLAGGRSS